VAAGTVAEVTELLESARAAFAQYRIDEGAARLATTYDALRATPDPPPELPLRIRLTASWLTFDRQGLAAADRELLALRTDATAAHLPGVVAACDVQRALLLARCGDVTAALVAMRAAEENRHALGAAEQVRLLVNRGTLAYHALALDDGIADLRAAADASVGDGMAALRFSALHNLGCAEFVRGDLPAALCLLDEAASLDVAMNRGVSHLDRARVLVEAGLVRDAARALRDASAAFAESGHSREVAEIEVDLARCELLLGDATGAAARAGRVAATFRDRGEPYWADRAALIELAAGRLAAPAAEATGGRQVSERIGRAERLLAAATTRRDLATAGLARLEFAEALCDRGRAPDLAAAAPVLDAARGLSRSPYVAARLGYAHARTRLDLAAGRPRSATARLARAAQDLAGAQRRTAGLDARSALAVHAQRLADLDVGLAVQRRDPVAVLYRVERWRRAVAPLTPVRPSAHPDEALLLSRLRYAREALAQASPPRAADLRAEVRRLERATSAYRWRARTIAPGHAVEEPTYAHVRDAVTVAGQRGTAVLALVVIGGRVFAVVVPPAGRAQLLELGEAAALRLAARRVSRHADAAARGETDPRLGPLIAAAVRDSVAVLDELLRPALRLVGAVPAVVLAGELFGAIAWGLLPSRRGLPTTLAPSLLAWAALAGARESVAPRRPPVEVVLPAGGDRRLDPPADMLGGAAVTVLALQGPGVPHGPAEAAGVLAAWAAARDPAADDATCRVARVDDPPGGSSREAPCASRDDLLCALASADVVHVAAHGDHQPESPLFSSLRMADGLVFAHELEPNPPSASLVVLSACEAGRGTARPGEEALGWPSALLALGVRTVIAPLVAVRDDEACAVMTDLHRHLAAGLPADAALAAAAGPTGTPFVCFGAPWAGVDPPLQSAEAPA